VRGLRDKGRQRGASGALHVWLGALTPLGRCSPPPCRPRLPPRTLTPLPAAPRPPQGIGCNVLCNDLYPSEKVKALGATYTTVEEILHKSDIVTLHCPLVPANYHMIDAKR
jgi:hypothetical protein